MSKYDEMKTEELFKLLRDKKDYAAREELIKRHIYIAEILSKKYINKGIDYDDIFQVACVGLVYSVDRFDIDRGFKFSSFATPTIVGEIKKHFRDKGWTIRVPRRIQELSKKITIAKEKLHKENARVPTVKDLSDYLQVSEEEIIETIEASKVYTPKSLDLELESISDDKDVRLMDIIGKEDDVFEEIGNVDFIEKVLIKLNPVEKKIIKDRFFDLKTQISVAKDLGVSQMTVSRIEKKVIKKFREEYDKTLNVM